MRPFREPRPESRGAVADVTRFHPTLLLAALLCPLGACQAPQQATADALREWTDIPVPRGFQVVDAMPLEAAVHAGSYRAGEYLFEGRGTRATVEQYYRDRMPQLGWRWDSGKSCWTKGDSRLYLSFDDLPKPVYGNDFGTIRYLMRVRSERAPLAPE